ncbi:MAG: PKD domain-containing protein, partial [Thermoplasmata archaeon]|nr:PKD domain-containing protein [Thermoplasmata archaeon]
APIRVFPTFTATIALSVPTPWNGLPVSLIPQLVGGDGIYACAWTFGDNLTASNCTTSHTWNTPGKYVVTLLALDNESNSVSRWINVTVTSSTPAPAPSSGGTGSGFVKIITSHLPLVGGAVVGLAVLVLLALLLSRRRRRRERAEAAKAPSSAPADPPPGPTA